MTGDGLTERERVFVESVRNDPSAPLEVHYKNAGFKPLKGTRSGPLTVLRRPAVLAAIIAPRKPDEEIEQPTEDELKTEIKTTWRTIMRKETASDDSKIKAGERLGSTIPGFFVPVEVKGDVRLSLESLVRQMGGAPGEELPSPTTHTLPSRSDDEEAA